MRIIHDIDSPMVASGGGKAFGNRPGMQGYGHFAVDLLIHEDAAANHPDLPAAMFGDDEAIYIEGDSRYIIAALEQALEILRGTESVMLEDYGPLRETNCPDGCEGIEKSNGNHAITCPRHPNFGKFGETA